MKMSRRDFLKATSAGIACFGLAQLGFDLEPLRAYGARLKISGAKEVVSVCPFCSVSCHVVAHVKDGRLVNVEGDPDYPINEGALCAKGAAILSLTNNPHRVTKPLYRAPFGDTWEEKDWEWVLDRIARRVKDLRDRDFLPTNGRGQRVNRLESLFSLGTSHMDNEECALVHQAMRMLGVVHMDHQARI
ncbi:formate dehydrogenase major subunit [Desulfacinum infernum DSM 9756]|uniref:Formate dehydrogenase major subunit n=3 Tax=Desulfacinum infernum TaxID=35837 RepID=A0A1M4XY77_9BACT|nr:formate dehydrogenase major subunit [Desulfacinum infernum DSM 9756]